MKVPTKAKAAAAVKSVVAEGTKANGTKQFQVTRARCNQCGKELKHVPFSLNNIICRDCYGNDRKVRTLPNRWVPGQSGGGDGPEPRPQGAAMASPADADADEAHDTHGEDDADDHHEDM